MRRALLIAAFACALAVPLPAQQAATQPQDPDFARLVHQWTTRPDFISPLVDHLPKVAGVPSPKDVLGYYIGAPDKLTYYADILKYYRALAAASPRVKVLPIGTSDEGRELVVVFVGSEESIRNLDTYRGYLAKLADPRTITDAQAQEIVAKAKPIYHLMGGLHSGEVGPSEMLMELAYRIATEDSPIIDGIRNDVIVSITPVADPDGRDRNVDWYNLYGPEDKTHNPQIGVPYWGKYVFHDDNRDINYSQASMRALLDWYLQWHPPIMHDLHQSETLLYTFSGQAPQNPNLDPILYGELPMMANFEMSQFAKYGMPGVWTHAFVDMWSPGYLAFMSSNHNGMIRMYEIEGFDGATTQHVKLGGGEAAGGRAGRGGRGGAAAAGGGGRGGRGSQTQREWYRPWPATGEFDWSIRDNVNYGETGVLTGLQYTSMMPKIILGDFYQKSRNSIDAARKDKVAGYVIPVQRDMTRVERVVNLLRLQGIEVGKARAEVKLKDGTFPAGSFVVKRNQPYGRLAKILLEKQDYPDPSLRTYDDSAWTMGLMSHAEVKEIDDTSVLDVPVAPVDELKIAGTEAGSGHIVAVAHEGSNNMITLRYRLKDLPVDATEKAFSADGIDFPAGSFVVEATGGAAATVKSAIEDLGLRAAAIATRPNVPMHPLDLPRLAVYSTWGSTQDVGWVRYAFDKYGVPYDLIYKERVDQGHLRDAYDVIVIPNQAGTAKRLVFDIESRGKPIPYKKSDRFKTLGMYGESDDITGGMGLRGVAELDAFVRGGGVLVTLGTASYFPAEFGLTPKVDAARPSQQFYAPGPIVEAEILQPQSPIFYGYDKHMVPVRYGNGPLLSVQRRNPFEQADDTAAAPASDILMRYPGGDDHVLSGLMRGANEIRNRAAIIDEPEGSGRVILFAGNPCYRWQNFGEFNMLFNTVLNYDDLATPVTKAEPADKGR
ncbi:MAG TPA: M14 family zinc carboxypeptidase [Vicinamibacterales bacterium]|nr:M14 family zinc carboxypeptidase [Vicinamibacterales bacterium]